MLDEMYKQKIDMSDEIYVINVGGYIGESTKTEIEYAKVRVKKISYLVRKSVSKSCLRITPNSVRTLLGVFFMRKIIKIASLLL